MTYTCKICGKTSDAAEFYRGVTSRCKECHKEMSRKNRAENLEYYSAYDAKRFQLDPRVRQRHALYRSTEQGRNSMNAARAKWLAGNAIKRAAHVILGNAVRDGRIEKPLVCSECGAGGRIDGHHDDYSLPLVVSWLCRMCHVAKHCANK